MTRYYESSPTYSNWNARRNTPRGTPSSRLSKEAQRICQTATQRSRAFYSKQATDLDKKLQFPDNVQTSLRPDIVIQSTATKRLVIVELTLPWEERCQSAYELKKAKYTDLQTLCKERGWLFQVEVGCWGFPAQSVWTTLSSLGIVGRQRRAAVKALGQAAERASSWLWLKRPGELEAIQWGVVIIWLLLSWSAALSVLGLKDRNTLWRAEPSWWFTSCGCAECCFKHSNSFDTFDPVTLNFDSLTPNQ